MPRLLCALLALLLAASSARAARAGREFSLDMWDWTAPCADLATFRTWCDDLKSIGVTRAEISAPWNRLEPTPGRYDLAFIADRLAIAKSAGLSLRVRLSTFYSGATPSWYSGSHELDKDGKPPLGGWIIPSVNDPALWRSFGPLLTAVARRFKGEDVYFSPFIGMHAELKWSDWWDYDPASLAIWRDAVHATPRPHWLSRIVGDAPLPETPPIAGPTDGLPDTNPATLAHIAFREHTYRTALANFVSALRAGDPAVKISVPLGESYRSESATIANLDYFGLSRGADQIVHSYDFFWHHKDPAWYAAASVAAFRGITRLPVQFEFDGPGLLHDLHYTRESLDALARAAISHGAGLKAANYSGSTALPHTYPTLISFGQLCSTATPSPPDPPPHQTVLLFVSKWANYAYREKTQWLHDAQFGAWKMLTDQRLPVRVICEDNLAEPDLAAYRALYVACSPLDLLPRDDRTRLSDLAAALPTAIELPSTPAKGFLNADAPIPTSLGRTSTLNYPLAYHYLHDHAAPDAVVSRLLRGDAR